MIAWHQKIYLLVIRHLFISIQLISMFKIISGKNSSFVHIISYGPYHIIWTIWNIWYHLFILRLTLDSCKICKGMDCTGDNVEIIKNACSDGTQLSTFISAPLSTLPDVNTYINTIKSDYSYQWAEMTLFQFPNTPESKLNIDWDTILKSFQLQCHVIST